MGERGWEWFRCESGESECRFACANNALVGHLPPAGGPTTQPGVQAICRTANQLRMHWTTKRTGIQLRSQPAPHPTPSLLHSQSAAHLTLNQLHR